MIRPQIIESLPIHHVGWIEADWDSIASENRFDYASGDMEHCQGKIPGIAEFIDMADVDARRIAGDRAKLTHNIELSVGVKIPQSFVSYVRNNSYSEEDGPKSSTVNKAGI